MFVKKELFLAFFALLLVAVSNAARIKRMYALCPPHFIRIGSECYYISDERVNWLDAHFDCKDRSSRLAEPFKYEDRLLRKYLVHNDHSHKEIWIGGIFNWEKNKWQWGYNGRDVTYQSFSQMEPGNSQNLRFHCAILNSRLKYRWSARSCVDRNYYICQHRMPYVNEERRQKVYTKWNETYPNEMANEIEIIVNEDDKTRNNRQQFQRLHKSSTQFRNEQPRRNPNRRNHPTANQVLDDRISNRIDNPNRQFNEQRRQRRPNRRNDNNISYRFEPRPGLGRGEVPRNRLNLTSSELPAPRRRIQQGQRGQRRRRPTTTTFAPSTTTDAPATTTTTTATTTTTTPPAPPTTQRYNPYELSEIDRLKVEEDKVRTEEEKLRREQEQRQRQLEEKRLVEENEIRENHLRENERQREEFERAERERQEIERVRKEKQHQDEVRRRQNEENRRQYEEAQRKQQELLKQREDEDRMRREHEDDLAKQQHLSNEIDAGIALTTERSKQNPLQDPRIESRRVTEEEKKRKRDRLRARLQNLTPEQQRQFFEKRAERNKKRDALKSVNNEAIPDANEAQQD